LNSTAAAIVQSSARAICACEYRKPYPCLSTDRIG
jgi:hypothetical protein